MGRNVPVDCRRGGTTGSARPTQVGVTGGGGIQDEGVGRRTGGATRRDRSGTELRRSQIARRMREFAT